MTIIINKQPNKRLLLLRLLMAASRITASRKAFEMTGLFCYYNGKKPRPDLYAWIISDESG